MTHWVYDSRATSWPCYDRMLSVFPIPNLILIHKLVCGMCECMLSVLPILNLMLTHKLVWGMCECMLSVLPGLILILIHKDITLSTAPLSCDRCWGWSWYCVICVCSWISTLIHIDWTTCRMPFTRIRAFTSSTDLGKFVFINVSVLSPTKKKQVLMNVNLMYECHGIFVTLSSLKIHGTVGEGKITRSEIC